MLTKLFLLAACVCASSALGLLPGVISKVQTDIKTVKVAVSNTAGGVIGSLGEALTGVPLALAQGVSGAGEWLAGILDKRDRTAIDFIKNRDTLATRYRDAVLNKNEDTTLRFPDLVKKYGYPCEEYEVKTDDGYLLTVFRIPHGVASPALEGKVRPVAFLMHGLVDSSDDWIIMGPGKSLGYLLADAGYDVWFGNARGNTHSKKHVNIPSSKPAFWAFTWDEIGRFDLPAMIDFALMKTNQKSVYYVGHSQGTTSFFVMCSMRPEYNAKIKIMFALAPIAWMSNMVSPMIRLLAPASKGADWITASLGVGEFLPNNQLLTVAGGVLCRERAITQDICSNSLFIVCGFDLDQMNTTMLPVIMGHSPSGSSVRQFLHYGQGVYTGKFCRYDWGILENIAKYGSRAPPCYDMSKVTAPVSLFYSNNDWLSHPKDVATLGQNLGNLVEKYLVPHPQYNHMDYMWAIDNDKLVNNRIIEVMKKY